MFAARAVRNLANELPRVKSERFALRIKISRGLLYGAVRAGMRGQEGMAARGRGMLRGRGRKVGERGQGNPEGRS